jgi:hypothetical protein
MSNENDANLLTAIKAFECQMQELVDGTIAHYESMIRDESKVKSLLEYVGEIPIIKRPSNEHKTDTEELPK